MSTENARHRSEPLWGVVDAKIAIVRQLWEVAKTLPAPSYKDPEGTNANEKARFSQLFQMALETVPGASLFYRFSELDNKIFKPRTKTPKHEVEEWQKLRGDDAVNFFRTLDRGIRDLGTKRSQVRNMLREFGGDWENPKLYEDRLPKDIQNFRGHIVKVMPQRFSISFLVDNDSWDPEFNSNEQVDAFGFHAPFSIWNVIPVYNWRWYRYFKISGRSIDDLVRQFHTHEDFHSAADRFFPPVQGLNVPSPDLPEYDRFYQELKSKTKRLQAIRKQGKGELLRKRQRAISQDIRTIVDYRYDELLADLVSLPDRKIPETTYVLLMADKYAFLQILKGLDPLIDTKISSVRSLLDLEIYKESIRTLYEAVGTRRPDKLSDLDAAFMLFPPSKFRHIRSLVQRWAGVI